MLLLCPGFLVSHSCSEQKALNGHAAPHLSHPTPAPAGSSSWASMPRAGSSLLGGHAFFTHTAQEPATVTCPRGCWPHTQHRPGRQLGPAPLKVPLPEGPLVWPWAPQGEWSSCSLGELQRWQDCPVPFPEGWGPQALSTARGRQVEVNIDHRVHERSQGSPCSGRSLVAWSGSCGHGPPSLAAACPALHPDSPLPGRSCTPAASALCRLPACFSQAPPEEWVKETHRDAPWGWVQSALLRWPPRLAGSPSLLHRGAEPGPGSRAGRAGQKES